MATDNSHDFPTKTAPQHSPSSATPLLWSVVTVFGSAILGGFIGLGIGAALGAFVPDYYRSVFSNGGDPHFNPFAVGIGQGLTQGVVFGTIVGLVLTAKFFWRRPRSSTPHLAWTLRSWIPALVLVFATLAVPVAFIVGGVVANLQVYDTLASLQERRLQGWLNEHLDKFGDVTVETSVGSAYLVGAVPTKGDQQFLQAEIQVMFGDELSEFMTMNVCVEEELEDLPQPP